MLDKNREQYKRKEGHLHISDIQSFPWDYIFVLIDSDDVFTLINR